MKSRIYILFLVMLPGLLSAHQTQIPSFICRNGLPNVAVKLKTTTSPKPITIAFIGGSITEAKDGWRDQVVNWLQSRYPKSTFHQVNAAIGGTGSSLGVFRADSHVFKYQPDLLFVEFAVNDLKSPRSSILKSMEGIVRKSRLQNPNADICFIYTFSKDMLESYQRGVVPGSVSAMEEVAAHYGIPSVNFAVDILNRLDDGKLFLSGSKPVTKDSLFFSGDGVHPYAETGHKYYFSEAAEAMNQMFKARRSRKHPIPSVLYSDDFTWATMKNISDRLNHDSMNSSDADAVTSQFASRLDNVVTLDSLNNSLELDFQGTEIGFLDIIGPESTQLKIEIDDEQPRFIDRFDKYCTYHRLHWFFIENLSDGKHHIKISINPGSINKFAILGKQPAEISEPAAFKKEVWRVGKILLNEKVDLVK